MATGTDSTSGTHRPWRGVTADERRAKRREQLIDAGFSLLGTEGSAAVTMRGVCREAKLTERYFYESFANREDLLLGVLAATADTARTALVDALLKGPTEMRPLIRHVVLAFTDFVTEDPRRGRVLLIESLAAPELAPRAGELVGEFTQTIAQALRGFELAGDEVDIELNAQAVFGSMAYLFQAWLEQRIVLDRERLVEHLSQIIEHLGTASSAHSVG